MTMKINQKFDIDNKFEGNHSNFANLIFVDCVQVLNTFMNICYENLYNWKEN